MPNPPTAEIRQFLTTAFNDDEFTTLCVDYFPQVSDGFTSGLNKWQKIQLLLDYCQRHEAVPNLLADLEKERPEQFKARFPQSSHVDVSPEPAAIVRDPRQVFISHAHQDAEFAHHLADDLRARGWRAWIVPESIRPGEKWVDAVQRGLDECGVFVVAMTPAAVRSRWVKSETNVAIGLEHRDQVRFFPLQVQDCNAPSLWTAFQCIYFCEDYARGLTDLVFALDPARGERERQARAAAERQAREQAARQAKFAAEKAEAERREQERREREAKEQAAGKADRMTWAKDDKEMVRVPAGEFMCQNGQKIALPEFWIDKTPVTNAEYARFVAETKHASPSHWKGKTLPQELAQHPVVYVSWHDAVAYATWVGKRLPTEQEWEKAARGTDGRAYPWGNQEPTRELCNFNQNEKGTTPVGKYSPQGDSPYGCVDMAGNVWEWVADWYDEKYYANAAAKTPNPQGPATGEYRVLRGGSWLIVSQNVRAALRIRNSPDNRNNYFGFRCAR